MTIQLSLFTAIILVVIIHTILTHLINWMCRNISWNDDSIIFGAIVVNIVEIVVLLATLNYLIP